VYFAATKTVGPILCIHLALGSAVANHFSAAKTGGDQAGLEAHVRDAVNSTIWPSLFSAVGILALGKHCCGCFSPKFTDAYPVMFILA
jgi:O-antigen/teichoic acid export membrane protein